MIVEKQYSIRPYRKEDLYDLYGILNDPEVMRFMEKTYSLQETEEFLKTYGLRDHPPVYALEDIRKKKVIGHIIFHPYEESAYEIGWIIAKEEQGKGIASACIESMISISREKGIRQLVIECTPDNRISLHLAEKYGFQYERKEDNLLVFRKMI